MEYYLAEGVACRVTERVFDHFPIKWDVMTHQLWYGISDGTALENLIEHCCGSFPFLYDACSTILFDKGNGHLKAIQVSLVEDYQVITAQQIDCHPLQTSGSLQLLQPQHFTCPEFAYPFYLVEQDRLLLLADKGLLLHYDVIGIDRDISFLLQDNRVLGLMVDKASEKTTVDLPPQELAELLQFYQAEVIDKMEDQDEELKQELLRHYKRYEGCLVQDWLANLLAVYYGVEERR